MTSRRYVSHQPTVEAAELAESDEGRRLAVICGVVPGDDPAPNGEIEFSLSNLPSSQSVFCAAVVATRSGSNGAATVRVRLRHPDNVTVVDLGQFEWDDGESGDKTLNVCPVSGSEQTGTLELYEVVGASLGDRTEIALIWEALHVSWASSSFSGTYGPGAEGNYLQRAELRRFIRRHEGDGYSDTPSEDGSLIVPILITAMTPESYPLPIAIQAEFTPSGEFGDGDSADAKWDIPTESVNDYVMNWQIQPGPYVIGGGVYGPDAEVALQYVAAEAPTVVIVVRQDINESDVFTYSGSSPLRLKFFPESAQGFPVEVRIALLPWKMHPGLDAELPDPSYLLWEAGETHEQVIEVPLFDHPEGLGFPSPTQVGYSFGDPISVDLAAAFLVEVKSGNPENYSVVPGVTFPGSYGIYPRFVEFPVPGYRDSESAVVALFKNLGNPDFSASIQGQPNDLIYGYGTSGISINLGASSDQVSTFKGYVWKRPLDGETPPSSMSFAFVSQSPIGSGGTEGRETTSDLVTGAFRGRYEAVLSTYNPDAGEEPQPEDLPLFTSFTWEANTFPPVAQADKPWGPDICYLEFLNTEPSFQIDSGVATLTVVRRGMAYSSVSVEYETQDVIAESGVHYVATSGTLEFGIGETTKIIEVPLINSTLPEPPVYFLVNLLNWTGPSFVPDNYNFGRSALVLLEPSTSAPGP